jgi:hypothetical protein
VKGIGGVSSNGNKMSILFDAMKRIFTMVQHKTESTDMFQQRLLDAIDAVRMAGGANLLRPIDIATPTGFDANGNPELTTEDGDAIEDEFLAMLFMCNADPTRYRSMLKKLKDDSHLGVDSFPKTWRSAYHAINNHSTDYRGRRDRIGNNNFVDVSFAQSKVVAGTDGKFFKDVTCYKCQNKGHFANFCPGVDNDENNNSSTGVGCAQFEIGLSQTKGDVANKDWILLDTCSTSNTFCSDQYLTSVKNVPKGRSYI